MSYNEVGHDNPRDMDMSNFREELGQRFREIERHYPNRATLAKSIGVGKSTLQSWIEGRSSPSFEALVRLAQVADVSLDWLAFGESSGMMRTLTKATAYAQEPMARIYNNLGDLYREFGWTDLPDQCRQEAADIYFGTYNIEDPGARKVAIDVAIRLHARQIVPPQTDDESQRSA